MTRITAGELQQKVLSDQTKYDAREVGHAMVEDIEKNLYESARLHRDIFDEEEYCVVMLIAEDPLIQTLKRRKFYCALYLPSPRPNQAVFLYNKSLDRITKRLWVLPSSMVMAELAGTNIIVHKTYATMQAWSVAFFKGTFWDYIRHEHGIDMLSEQEYISAHRDELIKAGCKPLTHDVRQPFDFDKISVGQIVDTKDPSII